MKNIFLGLFALALLSATHVPASGGAARKVKKAAVSCSKGCPDSKSCKKGEHCPVMPGCVCG